MRTNSCADSRRSFLHTCICIAALLHVSFLKSTLVDGKPAAEGDGWSEWTMETACSRSCGGGVQRAVRSCLKTRHEITRYESTRSEEPVPACTGSSRSHVSCNTQDCPEGSRDFRAVQCDHFNSVSFNGTFYKWQPHYTERGKCELYCMAEGEQFYYKHAEKVVDGTPCSRNSLDTCVDGVCQPVGCDKKLGSLVKYYYEPSGGRCRQFYYGGCGGNDNIFSTEEECEKRCSSAGSTTSHVTTSLGPSTEDPYQLTTVYDASRVPSPVPVFEVTERGSNHLRLRWAMPRNQNSILRGYQIKYLKAPPLFGPVNMIQLIDPVQTEKKLQGLEPDTTYYVYIYAKYATGNSEENFIEDHTRKITAPDVPVIGDTRSGEDFVRISLRQPNDVDNTRNPGNRFYVEYKKSDAHSWMKTEVEADDDWISISPLEKDVTYDFRLVALNDALIETRSEVKQIITSQKEDDICSLPMESGPCRASLARWHYVPSTGRCRQFAYGGCEGNRNKFLSERLCMQRCGGPGSEHLISPEAGSLGEESVRGVDEDTVGSGETEHHGQLEPPDGSLLTGVSICLLPRSIGPCRADQQRWYFNSVANRCQSFQFGGCGGNANNFETEEECNQMCHSLTIEGATHAPTRTKEDCLVPKSAGACDGEHLRYYWDPEFSECRPFIYGGCNGNNNNFVFIDDCYTSCSSGEPASLERRIYTALDCFQPVLAGQCFEYELRYHFDSENGNCAAFYYGGCGANANNFRSYDDCIALCSKAASNTVCGLLSCSLNCPHGYARDKDGCHSCQCINHCENHVCPENTQCYVESIQCVTKPCPEPVARCRAVIKPGECPKPEESSGRVRRMCSRACEDDTQCEGSAKCCSSGCGMICLQPALSEESSKLDDIHTLPSLTAIQGESITISGCRSHQPSDTVWYKNSVELTLDGTDPRLGVTSDGLFLHTLKIEDSAVYTCRLGSKIESFSLAVHVPASFTNPAPVYLQYLIGKPMSLRCDAVGEPRPTVVWLQNNQALRPTHRKNVRDNDVIVSDVQQEDAGVYTCQVYNGVGGRHRKSFNVEIIDTFSVTLVSNATDNDTFAVSDEIQLSCHVRAPTGVEASVHWTLNGEPVDTLTNERFTLSPSQDQLFIENSVKDDSGVYECKALRRLEDGEELSASASLNVTVEGVPLPEKCLDKPWYANCQLILEARLCRHAYFSIFCCKTCYEAGHLP